MGSGLPFGSFIKLQLPMLTLAQAPGTPDIHQLIEAGLSKVYGLSSPFDLKQSRVGDAASGVEVARTNEMLAIDVTPCASRKIIVTFAQPYRESRVSDQRCGDKTYNRLQVIQLQ
jgi:hypothetical protein